MDSIYSFWHLGRLGSVEEAKPCPSQKERREAVRVEMKVVVHTATAWATSTRCTSGVARRREIGRRRCYMTVHFGLTGSDVPPPIPQNPWLG